MEQNQQEPTSAASGEAGEPAPDETEATTNLLVADMALLAGTFLGQLAVRIGLRNTRFDPETARKQVEKLPKSKRNVAAKAARLASRSLPGAALVGTGLVGKLIFDRSQKRRTDRRAQAERSKPDGDTET
jgi:hypothetical protein